MMPRTRRRIEALERDAAAQGLQMTRIEERLDAAERVLTPHIPQGWDVRPVGPALEDR